MTRRIPLLCLAAAALALAPRAARAAEDLDDLKEKAIKAALAKVGPSVVQIVTSGGTDIIGGPRGVRKGIGPTSGVVLTADGYIISSAFNFANKPSSIIVAIPGQKETKVAKVVATDQTRMLTLLKVDATGLVVPEYVKKDDIKIGQTALALGRTFNANVSDEVPSVHAGIISAKDRIWGKAIQTDAKVSPANYGGPLVDLSGRVQGVIVPASPRAVGETAGFEWYESGIGFAIPFEDILAVLPRLKLGKDLNRGVMGVNMKTQDEYGHPPVIGTVMPGSAAEKAGIKPDDLITHIGGKAVHSYAQVQHQLGNKYEGDTVEVQVKRGDKELDPIKVVLGSVAAGTGVSFLGILPVRDDPEPGVEVRYVYPNSPADKAGLKAGDRIMKLGRKPAPNAPVVNVDIKSRNQMHGLLDPLPPGTELTLDVKRKGEDKKTEQLKATLAVLPDEVPERLPEFATVKKALGKDPPKPKEDEKGPETGLLKRKSANGENNYWVFVPKQYDPNASYGIVVWLHPVGRNKQDDIDSFIDAWEDYCIDNHLILIGPAAANETTGWTPNESEFVQEAVKSVAEHYTVDRRRIVAHGMGVGGQMAFYLGFSKRDLFRGVATTGAALGNNPKERIANQPLSFFVVAGEKDPLKDGVKETKEKLTEHKYPAVYREIPKFGHEYLNRKTLDEIVRWIDSMDRM
jgi:S1-C subfamily serine protease